MTSSSANTSTERSIDALYRSIGEYAISFQWLETRVREIGWLLLDPHRKSWPPGDLTDLTNNQLLQKVERLYTEVVGGFTGAGAREYCAEFSRVIADAHSVRRGRNSLLHSAYAELKGGDEVVALIKMDLKQTGGDFRPELLGPNGMKPLMSELGLVTLEINFHYTQLIHWLPFDPKPDVPACGLKDLRSTFRSVG